MSVPETRTPTAPEAMILPVLDDRRGERRQLVFAADRVSEALSESSATAGAARCQRSNCETDGNVPHDNHPASMIEDVSAKRGRVSARARAEIFVPGVGATINAHLGRLAERGKANMGSREGQGCGRDPVALAPSPTWY